MNPKRRDLKFLAILWAAGMSLVAPGRPIQEGIETQSGGRDSQRLTAEDKAALADAIRMKAELGDHVWPGFGSTAIPVVLYTDRFEFLLEVTNPPAGWETVAGDDFQGRTYYRRAAEEPKAFALKIGTRWAGSLTTPSRMKAKVPLKISENYYAALLLHEVFHAFQAARAPDRFSSARGVYRFEPLYPFKAEGFAEAWNAEGAALAEAAKAQEADTISRGSRKFLDLRRSRRERAGLSPDLIAFEQELEWLEGLAKYVELGFYERAGSIGGGAVPPKPGAEPPYMIWDFARLGHRLGLEGGDLRFYLSGMAQARILDRISPDWRLMAMSDGVFLEDLLRSAAEAKGPSARAVPTYRERQ